ncbi:hypothetical protein [Novosphingobium taihuense]|uniref:Uncharacterized protein n=1 Tax=Novosphingobium taihuense TaxID=260085 RepID=A0A7W7ABU3_9SPHN|nr:hypothetical protein [Novosphingobium taihuense]MBB4613971.1 hypothetical protein [Novosphingobium taihuense]TWH86822.1 hypothetical protein IQ25_01099 [Novosphingobium taihuense]
MESTNDGNSTPFPPEMEREVARFRAALSASRSAAQLKLFDFLAERSADSRSPKEIEIAIAVFGGEGSLPDGAADSGVRVYVHRLRKRIDEFYAGENGARLVIPKGEYRLTLQRPAAVEQKQGLVERALASLARPTRWHWIALGAVLCLIVASAIFLPAGGTADDDARKLAATRFWSGLDDTAPVTLLAGDSFMLAETRDQNRVDRIIRDSAIQSREDLGQHLKSHPEAFYRLYDLDLHYAPASTVQAVWDLQASFPPTRSGKTRKLSVSSLSGADGSILRARTMLYVGRLADLGTLRDTYRAVSKFVPEGDSSIRDIASGKVLGTSSPEAGSKDAARTTDIGTIASMRAPDGRRLIFISGLGDLALADMVRLVTDPVALGQLEARARKGRYYEALFQVRSVDGIQTDRQLEAIHPLG